MSEADIPVSEPCPECGADSTITQQLTAAVFGNPISMGHIKTPAGFTQVLDRIHKGSGKRGPRESKFSEHREV